jgi:ectoine hydroxylase-related dioxygenase (phytanoyl-CoA dioxygenase family)
MMPETLTSNPVLSAEQVAQFERDGFVVAPALSDAAEILTIQCAIRRLFSEQAGRAEGAQYDLVGHDEEGSVASLPQLIDPMNYAAELRNTTLLRNALQIARQLLGPTATFANDHTILKPALHGKATPWHQDEAYRADGAFDYQELSFWIPLQDVTLENGCMHYVAGSHKGEVLTHRSVNGDPKVHALECIEMIDTHNVIACPVSAGSTIVHHGRTLHYAGPNMTAGDRYAYVLIFEAPPKHATVPRNYYWNMQKQTARLQRYQQWSNSTGIVSLVTRKAWRFLNNPKRYYFKLKNKLSPEFKAKA